MYRVRADRFAGRAAHHGTGFEVEARAVRAAGDDQPLHPPVGEGKAVMGAHVVNGKKAPADAEHREALAAGDERDSPAFGKIGEGTYSDATSHGRTCASLPAGIGEG